jgi:hypothetical protein
MTRTRQVSALLVGLALAVGNYAGGFAAEPKPSGGGVTAGPAASIGSASGAAGTVAPTPAAARGYRAAEGGTPYPRHYTQNLAK